MENGVVWEALPPSEATKGPQLTPVTQIPEEGVVLAQAHSPAGSSRTQECSKVHQAVLSKLTLSQHCFSLRVAK